MKYYLITATDNHSPMKFVQLKEAIDDKAKIENYIPPHVPRIVEEWNRKWASKPKDAELHSEAFYKSQNLTLPNRYIKVKVEVLTKDQYDRIYKDVTVQNAI